MSHRERQPRTCSICGKTFPAHEVVAGATIRDSILHTILHSYPDWSTDGYICRNDLNRFRSEYVHGLLQSEKGELTNLENEVIRSLQEYDIISENVDAEFEREWTFSEKLSDRLAAFGGSWLFLILFGAFFAAWVGLNTLILVARPIDPYPFILLNLVLSCVAAIQAPVIMMSQNRQEAKDRLRSQNDYQINLKAELEIRHLHEKIDHLLSHQWERLVEIQEVQLELLSELSRKKGA